MLRRINENGFCVLAVARARFALADKHKQYAFQQRSGGIHDNSFYTIAIPLFPSFNALQKLGKLCFPRKFMQIHALFSSRATGNLHLYDLLEGI